MYYVIYGDYGIVYLCNVYFVVCIYLVIGKKVIFVNVLYIICILGVFKNESDGILVMFYELVKDLNF